VPFERLKELLTTAPILTYSRFGPGEEFVLETDASLEGLGAVLSQKQGDGCVHPIAYASRSLQPHQCNYRITELETLGVVWASKHFRPYLLGHHCLVLTDHSACISLLNASRPSAKLARWAMMIQELDLEIRHRPGRTNLNADALSRNPECDQASHVCEAAVFLVGGLHTDDHSEVTAVDEFLKQQFKDISKFQHRSPEHLENGNLPEDEKQCKKLVLEHPQYELIDGVLYNENPGAPGSWRIVVPDVCCMLVCCRRRMVADLRDMFQRRCMRHLGSGTGGRRCMQMSGGTVDLVWYVLAAGHLFGQSSHH